MIENLKNRLTHRMIMRHDLGLNRSGFLRRSRSSSIHIHSHTFESDTKMNMIEQDDKKENFKTV